MSIAGQKTTRNTFLMTIGDMTLGKDSVSKSFYLFFSSSSLDMATHLAKELKCVLVYSLYSRLLLDVNRCITAQTLFRKSGDGQIVDLNKG